MQDFSFGMNVLRITQTWDGTTSHRPHWYNSRNYADYPIDIAGKDSGRDVYYATVDMKVVAIRGIRSTYTNTIWLVATEKCNTPSGVFTPFIALTHWNDNDEYIKNHYVGKVIKKGEPICREGTDGANANHLHLVCGNADKSLGDDVILNSNNKWVSKGYCMKPEEVMYVNTNFTKVENTMGLNFVYIKDFLPSRGWFTKGDSGENVNKINDWLASLVVGNYYGFYTTEMVKALQTRGKEDGLYNDVVDGNWGAKTEALAEHYGFRT